ncbi:MAG: type VI secretion system baseplate subunit TssG [Bacteroidota bacterium]
MNLEALKKAIKQQPADLRLEVILGELIQNGHLKPEQIEVQPEGIFFRGSRRDLGKVEEVRNELGQVKKIVFHALREGLYDALPQGLFHRPKSRKYKKTAKEISEEVRAQEAEEAAARDFFQPIEQEYYGQRIQLEQEERDVFSGFSSKKGQRIFLRDFWGLALPGIPPEQITALLYILPLSYTYKGVLPKVEEIMQAVMRQPIRLIPEYKGLYQADLDLFPGLGETFLGLNTVLGPELRDGMPTLRMEIGPMNGEELMDYLLKGKQEKLRKVLCHFFLPVDLPVDLKFVVSAPDKFFELQDDPFAGRLGHTTVLT